MTEIRFRRGPGTTNPILADGEPGYRTTTDEFVVGDGVTALDDLDPSGGPGPLAAKASTAALTAESSARITADTALTTAVNLRATITALNAETSARTTADAGEAAARTTADATISATQTATAAQTQRFLGKLYSAEEDAAILIISDSTAALGTRWAYLSTVALAARYPAWTVVYHLWDPTGEAAYDTGTAGTPTTVQTGTGPRTMHIWNFSVSGKSTSYGLAGRFPLAIAAVTPDLVVVAHGKNEQNLSQALWAGRMLSLTEAVTAAHPYAGLAIMLQCPNTGDTLMAQRNKVYQQIAALRGYGIINVHDAFMATGHPADFVRSDLVHPTDASDPAAPPPGPGQTTPARDGSALWAQVFMEAMRYDPTASFGAGGQQPSAFTQEASQLLPNGSFSAFTTSVPDSWTATGATTTKDVRAGWFEGDNAYGVRVQATGAAASYLQQSIAGYTKYRGKWVTLRVRLKQAASATTGTSGRISLADGVTTIAAEAKPTAMDGFFDQVISMKVSLTATYLRVTIYADSAANAAADITIARADIVAGVLPKSGVLGLPGPSGPAGPTATGLLDFMSSVGPYPAIASLSSASGVFGVNQAIAVKFIPHRDVTVTGLRWGTAAVSSGNYDIGIYTAAGVKLWAAGSTAWPAVSTAAQVTVPPLGLTAGTPYLLVLAGDNATGTFRGVTEAITNQLMMLDGSFPALSLTSAFPLPTSFAPGSTRASRIPMISLIGT